MHYISASIIALILLTAALLFGTSTSGVDNYQPRAVVISPQARTHILYGDDKGGGHHHAANKPCKSEFPEDWSEQRIIDAIELIASNDNLNWKQQKNGYYTGEQQVGHLKIRVILNDNKTRVITGYPLNVVRNRCAANDNNRD